MILPVPTLKIFSIWFTYLCMHTYRYKWYSAVDKRYSWRRTINGRQHKNIAFFSNGIMRTCVSHHSSEMNWEVDVHKHLIFRVFFRVLVETYLDYDWLRFEGKKIAEILSCSLSWNYWVRKLSASWLPTSTYQFTVSTTIFLNNRCSPTTLRLHWERIIKPTHFSTMRQPVNIYLHTLNIIYS